MVATATRTILENLDRIPDEDERTKIAIICYDVSLYFFSMPVCSFLDLLLAFLKYSFSDWDY
jgi:protein transport protein SEC24